MAHFYFSPFPTILFNILDRDDIIMYLVIAGFGKNGCNISYESWKERYEVGSDAVNRSRKKLEFLCLIKVERKTDMRDGVPHKSYRSFVVSNPYDWRLTTDLNRQIEEQSRKLSRPVGIFTKEPFKNIEDFECQFNVKYPNLRIRRKGRQSTDDKEEELVQIMTVDTIPSAKPTSFNLWKTALQQLLNPEYSFTDLVLKFIFYEADILKVKNGFKDDYMTTDFADYLIELHRVYSERCASASYEESRLCYFVDKLKVEGLDAEQINARVCKFSKDGLTE